MATSVEQQRRVLRAIVPVSPAMQSSRTAMCEACPHRSGEICQPSGLLVELITASRYEACPAGKWAAYDVPTPTERTYGLGDLFAWIASLFGFRKSKGCGCERRQRKWNAATPRWMKQTISKCGCKLKPAKRTKIPLPPGG